jgi:hypothetical protein
MTEGSWEGRGQVAPQGVRRPFVQSENALRVSAVHEPSTAPDSRARHQICVQITGCATVALSRTI